MNKQLLKRADVLEWAGLSIMQYRKMLENRVLKPVKIKGYKHAFFRRNDVAKALQLEEAA